MKGFNFLKYTATLLVLLFALKGNASEADRLIISADSAYNAGEFAKAVELYNSAVEKSGSSSELYFNLGNAYSKGGDYGRAMLAYQRALRIDPSNKKATDNIRYINYKVQEANKSELRGKKYSLDSESDSFFTSVRKFIVARHSSDTWAMWAAICFILFIGSVAAYIFSSNVWLRKIGFFGGMGLLGICVVTLVFAFMGASYKSEAGVIVSPKVKLHTEAALSSKEAPVALTRGTTMRILDIFPAGVDNPQWYKVKLNSDFIGWIQATDFEPVE